MPVASGDRHMNFATALYANESKDEMRWTTGTSKCSLRWGLTLGEQNVGTEFIIGDSKRGRLKEQKGGGGGQRKEEPCCAVIKPTESGATKRVLLGIIMGGSLFPGSLGTKNYAHSSNKNKE